MDDTVLIEKIKTGEKELYKVIIQKYNQRLYRIARSIVKNEDELEDILQDTYLKAYVNLSKFRNDAQFSTWLVRILINNANASLNKAKRWVQLLFDVADHGSDPRENSDHKLSNGELKKILEDAIDTLPENLRSVYLMREVEHLSVNETADILEISPENVKIRLHRAKSILKNRLYDKSSSEIDLFRFGNERFEKVPLAVMLQIGKQN
ncbi:MAG TPA: RNA polymerase sigma factor [Cytophagaceae bacterium]|jgi:RNA polymerase sigma-70 factor (ECF subfamily)